MVRIFIGFDPVERIAYHTLAHSIIERTTSLISITPIGNAVLDEQIWQRPRGEHDSTEFSNARWLIPELCQFQGHAIFMDCDMICYADIADLWVQRSDDHALVVRKHDMRVRDGEKKFLGTQQAAYNRKNWSSVMVINCAHPSWKSINPQTDEGLDLHQLVHLSDEEIGAIKGTWNQLLAPGETDSSTWSQLSHFTWGGPWHGWTRYYECELWCRELRDMLGADNPCAHINVSHDQRGVYIGGAYHVTREDEEAEEAQQARLQAGSEAA